MGTPLLEVKNLSIHFHLKRGTLAAAQNISFSLQESETFGIVGETGCGKTVTSLSILRLIPSPPGEIASGEILFEGEDLLKKSAREMEKIRGRRISMVFQEPMTSLNPSLTVGEQIAECYRVHMGYSKKVARDFTENILGLVRLPSPKTMAAFAPCSFTRTRSDAGATTEDSGFQATFLPPVARRRSIPFTRTVCSPTSTATSIAESPVNDPATIERAGPESWIDAGDAAIAPRGDS